MRKTEVLPKTIVFGRTNNIGNGLYGPLCTISVHNLIAEKMAKKTLGNIFCCRPTLYSRSFCN